MERKIEAHPSYGLIGISKITMGKGKKLFGASVKHSSLIQLEISKAKKSSDPYSTHYFPSKPIATVFLTPSQFSNMILQANTTGVPCTINYTESEGNIPLPEEKSTKEEMDENIQIVYSKILDKILELKYLTQNELKGAVKADTKEKIKNSVTYLYNMINSNLDFFVEQQKKKLEQMGSEMVAEAEAIIRDMVHNAGIKTLQIENEKESKYHEGKKLCENLKLLTKLKITKENS